MKLVRLAIARLPGIDDPFTLEPEALGPGFNVIVGPNGIGKSSLCRAVEALLWKEVEAEGVRASAIFEIDGERWAVEREGPTLRWQRDGVACEPPPLPGEHLRSCFFFVLRDLLELTREAGLGQAAAIRRQMAGGFDLAAVRNGRFPEATPHARRQASRRLDDANQALAAARAAQEGLARRQDELAEREQEAARAEEAQRRLARVDDALALANCRRDHEGARGELTALPEALADLTGRELTEIESLEAECSKKTRLRTIACERRDDAQADIRSTRLAEPLSTAELQAWEARADELSDRTRRHEDASTDRRASEAALAEATAQLSGREEPAAQVDLANSARLLTFLREAHGLAEKALALDERLRLLAGREAAEESQQRLDATIHAVAALRAWLRIPDATGADGAARSRAGPRRALVTAILLILTGLALGLADGRFVGLSAVGLGMALAALWSWPRAGDAASHAALRTDAEKSFPASVEPPPAWSREAVAERLRELESEQSRLDATLQRARDRGVDREALESQRRALDEPIAAMERRRRELADRLGLAAILEDAELVETTRALGELRTARARAAAAREKEADLEEKRSQALAGLREFLASHGEAEPTDAASAQAGVASLRDRSGLLRSSRNAERTARNDIERLDGEIEAAQRAIAGVYERARLAFGDRAGLGRLLDDRERYNELRQRVGSLAEAIRQAEQRLIDAGEAALCELDSAALSKERDRLTSEAARVGELREEIVGVRHLVTEARKGHVVSDALAERDAAVGALADLRDRELYTAGGRFLLDAVEREHERTQRPRVLERARELFGSFTHSAYELRVPPDEASSFVAVETRTGRGLHPDQLSDGTRAQLLLASRLAFAEEVEPGSRVPFFFDEALDHSDPVRFHEIVRNLAQEMARGGRQIFYLTNDPNDVPSIDAALAKEGLGPATLIDLGALRRRSASVPDRDALRVEPLPEIPDPAGHDARSYGETIGVPPLSPHRGASDQHLFHVLWDDLALLHRLLVHRIERVGAWRSLSAAAGPIAREIQSSSPAGRELDDRIELLEVFCLAHREGRGRSVSREVLEKSGAVSNTFLERVRAVNRELEGDAEALLGALRARTDERLRGFREKSADDLEAFFLAEGYLDRRTCLSKPEITSRLLASPAAARLPEGRAAACAHRWWELASARRAD